MRSFDDSLEVRSAGTFPAGYIQPLAIRVMKEAGIDISGQESENVDKYTGQDFDYVITVCDDANETCPHFSGKVRRRIHMGFEDPTFFDGTEEERLQEFRRVRDRIKAGFSDLYRQIIKS